MKTAVIYYSMSGNCEYTAKKIAALSDADLIRLEPEKEFPENFKRMNRDFLAPKAATRNRIFFVDDNLVTGRTFFSIYDLFRYSSGYGGVVLSGSIFLMNKASARTNEHF